ncbi:MAG: histidine kinase [Actinomycetota bacterium]
MTSQSAPEVAVATAARGARLTRGITATWWYTIIAVIFLEVMLVLIFMVALLERGHGRTSAVVVGIGGLLWVASTVMLLFAYRQRTESGPIARWSRVLIPLLVTVAFAVTAGLISGIWAFGVMPLAQSLVLLNWPPGVRLRIVVLVTLVLAALWFVDARITLAETGSISVGTNWWLIAFYSTSLPMMSILSLWWWDVLVTLDRARASEARLGATQERLRVATDVHDLQGHHLQVIALQLELAERLMERDPEAALAQLRASRASVDEARQGTRDLALRFRSVPLRDELANAVDLLRAAGTNAEATVDPDSALAPAAVLGPVIRETTTNVLRHGGGQWARLSLTREGDSWRYSITNDAGSHGATDSSGSGLEGLARRATDAGGTIEIRREKEFAVIMTVPAMPGTTKETER